MTDKIEINYDEFVSEFIKAMKESDTAAMEELPKQLVTEEEKSTGLSKLLAAIDAEEESFKEDNGALITALIATKEAQTKLEANAEGSVSEAATESADDAEKAVEPETVN